MSSLPNPSSPRLAVSLSGGGHRATLYALGALMYLVDSEASKNVTSIASVSGGSLTNGLVGQEVNFRKTNSQEFRDRVARRLATQISNSGTLFAPLYAKIYVVFLVLSGIAALLIPAIVPAPWFVRLLVLLATLLVWGWILGIRGRVCACAFQTTLYSPNGRATKLADLKIPDLDHVICSTEFRSAEQVYFAGDFVYSYALGYGVPGDLPLARAVQASAAFPGGFPPSTLSASPHKFAGTPPTDAGGAPQPLSKIVLTDGGVYDNMGEQWARGFAERIGRCPNLGNGRQAPEQLVVVNASARVPWSPFRQRLFPLLGELAALLRVNNILYINTTNVRRQVIVDSFNPADPTRVAGIPSVLVQIAQSPFRVATSFAKGADAVGERGREVLKFLGSGPSEADWTKIARENAKVATSLSKFGPEVTARLIYQGYVVAMCNLHVLFGPEYPLIPDGLELKQFRDLIS